MVVRKEQRLHPRLIPLAAAIMMAGLAVDAGAGTPAAAALAVAMPNAPGGGRGVAALMQALHQVSVSMRRGSATSGGASTRMVTSCADDAGAGTLRNVLALANSGDTIELEQLSCSAITLTQGAIPVKPDAVTIHGAGAQAIAIDGGGSDRVFVHYGYDTLTVSGLTVRNGVNYLSGFKVAGGACILGNGYVTLDHASVSDCRAVGEGAYGGGILARGVTLYTSKLSGNVARGSLLKTMTAAYGGGAFAYRATIAMYDSTVSGNSTLADAGNRYGGYDTGAGVFSDNGGYLLRSALTGNVSDGTGGAFATHGSFFVIDSTISGNRAKTGGGVFLRTFGTGTISNSTIAHNTATAAGGGIYVSSTPLAFALESTIVADNAAPTGSADVGARDALTIVGANDLVMAVAAVVTLPPGTLHSDPGLLALADNGGPTPTHALAPDSPARDAGNNTAQLATDQRGVTRVLGRAPDIGAFEASPQVVAAAPAAVPTSTLRTLALIALLCAMSGVARLRRWPNARQRQVAQQLKRPSSRADHR